MFNRIKSAPTPVLVLFALVLSLEISSFVVLLQFGALVRFFLLTALMFLTLGGLRIARNILVFLLFTGALFLAVSGVRSPRPLEFTLFFHFSPAILLTTTALYLLLSRKFEAFLLKKPTPDHELQSL